MTTHIRRALMALALAMAVGGVAPGVFIGPSGAVLQAGAQTGQSDVIRAILVEGNRRIEPATILSYLTITAGDQFSPARIDTSLKVLFATGLFADVAFARRGDVLVVQVTENPIINRVVFEGNRALGEDKLSEEIQAQPRAIFTRARVQSDVQRMVQLYRQSGRFAASIDPKVVELPQNRVDLVFEISEGPVTGVRAINFIGNRDFTDRKLRGAVLTAQSRFWKIFNSNDNYDPDRLEYDRELLRQFYTDKGYADFSVLSAVAELTPDQEDFFVTFTVEEGEPYEFGKVTVTTELDTLDGERLARIVPIKEGQVYQASKIEDAKDALTFAAGAAGYAFSDVRTRPVRNREERIMDIEFVIREGPRVYIERIDVVGNTQTLDRVVRRELSLVEGDAFNRVLVNRSQNRVRALGFFQDVAIEELPGSEPDRVVLQTEVTEQPTGELSFGAGFSSVDSFLFDMSITQRNLRGRGQFLRLSIQAAARRQTYDIRFTEPRFAGRNVAAGFELFSVTQDFLTEAGFRTQSSGASVNLGFPLSENATLGLRYTLRDDDTTLGSQFGTSFLTQNASGLISQLGYTVSWDRRNNPVEPTRGFVLSVSQDLAGFGGDVRFLRTQLNGKTYRGLLPGVVASLGISSGYIAEWGGDEIRRTDRFFKGGSSFRGFDVLGLGPREVYEDPDTGELLSKLTAVGGQLFAVGTAELSIPTFLPEEYGINGALFAEVGTLGVVPEDLEPLSSSANAIRDDLSMRASAGISIFWDSPLGPIRFDFSEILAREDYDRTESFRFSTSTRF